jgi:predicted anti-sigma-YlaC factor YlaD
VDSSLSCKAAIHLICWYLEGKLSASVAHEVEAHLGECKDCYIILEAATTTLEAYFNTVADRTLPDDVSVRQPYALTLSQTTKIA